MAEKAPPLWTFKAISPAAYVAEKARRKAAKADAHKPDVSAPTGAIPASQTTTKEPAAMARSKKLSAPPPNFSETEKREKIAGAFPELRRLLLDVVAKRNEHIKPLTDAITRLKRRLKADTGTEWADVDPLFRLYMREQLAEETDEAGDAERIRANLKRSFLALKEGETLDLFALFNVADGADAPESDAFERAAAHDREADGEHESEGRAAEPSPLDALGDDSTQAEEPEPAPAPDANWAAAAAADDESFDDAGHAYHEAVKAGSDAFHMAVAESANPYPVNSVLAKAWTLGYCDEEAKWQPRQAAQDEAGATETAPALASGHEDDADGLAHVHQGGAEVVSLAAAQ
jgi:hypothetical protein